MPSLDVPSPSFITPAAPTGSITISWSEIDAWRQCPYKWRLAYGERWVGETPSPALSKGTLWHKVLEIHYLSIMVDSALSVAIDKVQAYLNVVESEWVQLIAWMYNGYIQHWQNQDRELIILQVEPKIELPLMPGINVKCRLDLLVRDWDGMLWMWDHKSCKNLPTKKETDLDDQFALYQWIINQSDIYGRVFGVIHNAARTQQNTTPQTLESRHARLKMIRSDEEQLVMIEEIKSTALDILAAYQNLDKAVTAVTPRHPDPDRCKWRCDFTSPCILGRGTGHHRTQGMLLELGARQDFTRH
jgi:hypothetical protein